MSRPSFNHLLEILRSSISTLADEELKEEQKSIVQAVEQNSPLNLMLHERILTDGSVYDLYLAFDIGVSSI